MVKWFNGYRWFHIGEFFELRVKKSIEIRAIFGFTLENFYNYGWRKVQKSELPIFSVKSREISSHPLVPAPNFPHLLLTDFDFTHSLLTLHSLFTHYISAILAFHSASSILPSLFLLTVLYFTHWLFAQMREIRILSR